MRRACVTSSERRIQNTSALPSEERPDMGSHFCQGLQASVVPAAISRRRATKQPSIWDRCARGRGRTAQTLGLDASWAVEHKDVFLCPASRRLREARRRGPMPEEEKNKGRSLSFSSSGPALSLLPVDRWSISVCSTSSPSFQPSF